MPDLKLVLRSFFYILVNVVLVIGITALSILLGIVISSPTVIGSVTRIFIAFLIGCAWAKVYQKMKNEKGS